MQAFDDLALFSGGGEMGRLMREFDWHNSPLGSLKSWPQSLRTTISILLNSKYPMFIAWDPEKLIFLYNDAYIPILGDKHPQALGLSFAEIWNEIWDDLNPLIEKALQGQATWSDDQNLIMKRHGYKEETYFTFSYSPVRDETGGVGGMFCACTETTRKVLGDRQLALLRDLAIETLDTRSWKEVCTQSLERLATNPYDLSFAVIYFWDSHSSQIHRTGFTGIAPNHPAAVSVISQENNANYPILTVLREHKVHVIENAQELFEKALPDSVWQTPTEKIALIPILPTGETGHEGVLAVGLNPYRLFDQDYESFLKLVASQIASAVSNARAYEAERRRAEALAEIDRTKTLFFSNISHEFRTPLTLMLGILTQVLNKPSPGASDKEELEVVHRNGLRLLKLVNSLLDFTRVEAGRMQAEFNPTDLGVFTAELASNFHSACEQAGVELEIDTTNANEQVYVDSDMWEKIVFNLLSNAFKFTFEGRITVTLETRHGQAILKVSDTGTGIPEVELPLIFDRFHRIQNARGRTHEGTGIGLALVHELVKLHGGIAEVNSVLGQGSTFTIKLPLGSSHLPSAQIGNEPIQHATGIREAYYVKEALGWLSEKLPDVKAGPDILEQTHNDHKARKVILLVDDNADMRKYLQKILSSKYQVLTAPDGQAALEFARRKTPDLVISDIMMPKLDGFGLLKALREDQDLCHLPIILLSARAGEEAEIEGLEARADDYLVKPFSSRELIARLDSIFAIKELRKEQEENFRVIADHSPAILWTTDPDGSCTYLNKQWYETTGGNPGDDLRFGWLEKVHPEDIEKTKTIFLDANKNRIPFRLDYRLKSKNGEYSWATDAGMPRFDKAGRFLGFVGCVFDISESKRMEAVLYGQKQALELAMSGASLDAVLGIFTRAVERQSEENVIASILLLDETGKHLMYGADLSLPEEYNKVINGIEIGPKVGSCGTAAYTKETVIVNDIEHDPRWEDFKEIALSHNLRACWSAPIFSSEGKILGTFALYYPKAQKPNKGDQEIVEVLGRTAALIIDKHIDTKLREKSEQKLIKSEAALKDTDRRKDEFLATLAHELRNPLAPIGYALQIMEMSNDEKTYAEMRDLIGRQLKHMVRLVDDLMDVSRITRGKVDLRKEKIKLSDALETALESVRPLIEEQKQKLTVNIDQADILLNGDKDRLAQVFANILNNAAKYTQAEGEITVQMETKEKEVLVRIRDNGIGIPANKLPKIFDMFAQVDSSTGRSQGGLGIGLTLVKQLVDLHDGRVEAYSAGRDQGTTFTLYFPTLTATEEAFNELLITDENPPNKLKVLVVDDNKEAAQTLARMIALLGHNVRMENKGAEGINTAKEFIPDIVLLDIGMSEMDGYQVCKKMKKINELKDTVFIAQTGWGEKKHRKLSKIAGFDHHLVKPVDIKCLKEILKSDRQPL